MQKENYFRATVYNEAQNYSAILDAHNLFEKDWLFTHDLLKKGFSVLECGDANTFIECDVKMAQEADKQVIVRAKQQGKPKYLAKELKYGTYVAIQVGDKTYVPDKYEKEGEKTNDECDENDIDEVF